MTDFILQVLSRTPTWVWVVFVTLLVLGILQSKTRAVSGFRLFALPVAMLGFSLYGVWSAFGPHLAALLSWGAALLLAVFLARLLRQPAGVSYSRSAEQFVIPGSWVPLALMMTIFFTRYTASASLAIAPTLSQSLLFLGVTSLAYGALSGTLLARALHVLDSKKRL